MTGFDVILVIVIDVDLFQSGVVVYLRSSEGHDLVSSAGLKHTLPKEGPSW